MDQNVAEKTILIIDDEPDILELIATDVDTLGHKCVKANNGIEALNLLNTTNFDAILCDIKMPQMTGIEFLKQIRTKGIMIPLTFLTGYEDTLAMIQAIRLGALDFLTKPYDFNELNFVLEKGLEIGSRQREVVEILQYLSSKYPEEKKNIELLKNHTSQISRILAKDIK